MCLSLHHLMPLDNGHGRQSFSTNLSLLDKGAAWRHWCTVGSDNGIQWLCRASKETEVAPCPTRREPRNTWLVRLALSREQKNRTEDEFLKYCSMQLCAGISSNDFVGDSPLDRVWIFKCMRRWRSQWLLLVSTSSEGFSSVCTEPYKKFPHNKIYYIFLLCYGQTAWPRIYERKQRSVFYNSFWTHNFKAG